MSDVLIEGQQVTKRFGGLVAVNRVDFAVRRGEIFGLIGPNGAGKTTLFRVIAGVYAPEEGSLLFRGATIRGLQPHQTCHLGICSTHQVVRPFGDLSVLDNVLVGVRFGRGGAIGAREAREKARQMLDFCELSRRADVLAKSLTLAERKRLEVARALATQPELLLLDEVVAGLNPAETLRTMDLVRAIRDSGVTVLMVEHVMRAVMGLSDRMMVLHHGEKIAEGTPSEISRDRRVIEAYLGERYAEQETVPLRDGGR